jgi:hypothetical protein
VPIGFWWGNLREENHLDDRDVDGRIILKCISEKWDGDIDWIDLAEVRDKWRALVSVVINLWLPYNPGNFLIS